MKSKKVLIPVIAAAVILLSVLSIIIIQVTKKPVVGFYNVSKEVSESTLKILDKASGKNFEAIFLDSNKPLSSQNKEVNKCAFIVAKNDCDVTEFANKSRSIKSIPAAYLSDMPSTVANTVSKNKNTIKYVPLLFDFYQVDIHYPLYVESKLESLDYWKDLTQLALKEIPYTRSPIAIGGNDDLDFLNFLGVMIESQMNYKEYSSILEKLYDAYKKDYSNDFETFENIDKVLEELTERGATFHTIRETIYRLIDRKILQKDVIRYGAETGLNYANNNLCGIFFTTLSQHRTIDSNFIRNYKTVYCPSARDEERMFLAPEICLLSLENTKKSQRLILELCSKNQSQLSIETGLAPVRKDCATADRQANDVRYWLAASSGPLMPLSGALPDYRARKYVSEYLISYVLNYK